MATTVHVAASSPEPSQNPHILALLRKRNAACVRATHHPEFHLMSPVFHSERDAFGQTYFPDGRGLDPYVIRASELYMEHRAESVIRIGTSLAVASGKTLQELGDHLLLDRTVLSVAFNHGKLGSHAFANLLADSFVLAGFFNHSIEFRNQAGRAGFIAAAKFAAERVGSDLLEMNELSYELLCAVIAHRPADDLLKPVDNATISAVIAEVRDRLGTVPTWCIGADYIRRHTALALLKQLDDPTFATDYIHRLQHDWTQVFAYTFATVEGLGSEDLWHAE